MAEHSELLWGQTGGWGLRRDPPSSQLLLIKSIYESNRSPWFVCPSVG